MSVLLVGLHNKELTVSNVVVTVSGLSGQSVPSTSHSVGVPPQREAYRAHAMPVEK